MAVETNVHIEVFNIRGQKIKTLLEDNFSAGSYKIDWNGTDDNNRNVASGVYFYRMHADGKTESRRMVLLK